jgi:starch-binding outer membrane protein, SusD/RagB family
LALIPKQEVFRYRLYGSSLLVSIVHFKHPQKMKKISAIYLFAALLFGIGLTGCNKLIEIGTPENQLVTANVYKDTITMEAAMLGLYSKIANFNTALDVGTATSLFNGLSADEGYYYPAAIYDEFKNNALTPNVFYLDGYWANWYNIIYAANAIMEGGNASASLPDAYKARTTGEAKFIRALCYFYLVNEFGNVPLVLTTNVSVSSVQARESVNVVYDQIEKDLTDALAGLPANLQLYGGNRVRATTWAANALLARVYLFRGKWSQAATAAGTVIGNPGFFAMQTDLTKVFLANSTEGILQFVNGIPTSWMASNIGANATAVTPNFVLSDTLYKSFETNDARKTNWVGVKVFGGNNLPYPNKYRYASGVGAVEYAQLLRLAEQYLIRAEARTQLSQFTDAAADLNVVRNRAGLGNTTANDKATLLAAIEQECKIEFFVEWGHRWLDLKRWQGAANTTVTRADEVLSVIKGAQWQSTDALYPIPQTARNVNTNLTQNSGYTN